MNMVDALDRGVLFHPDREAVVCGEKRFTYKELGAAVTQMALGLKFLGVAEGDRICLYLHNRPEFLIALYGALKIGAVCVSLSPMIKADEVESLVNDCGAVVLITEKELGVNIPARELIPTVKTIVGIDGVASNMDWETLLADRADSLDTANLSPDAPATMIYTSGTTGKSKGVVLSHGNLVSNTNAAKYMCGVKGEDRSICFLPMSHSFAQNFISNSTIQAGGCIVILKAFEMKSALETMAKERITRFYAVPPIYILLMETPEAVKALESVTYCFSAASSLPGEVAKKWKERFGLTINEAYGLSETSPFATYNHEIRHKVGSVGTPIMNVELRIMDPEDNEVPLGEMGEIQIRGPNVMLGYFGKPEETAEVMVEGGWLRTGDVGYIDKEGYLFLADRIKDMINNAGLKVWPRQVEEVIYCHPLVRECAVIGVPHDVYGETVMAVVSLVEPDGVSGEEIRLMVKEKLSDYKVPRVVKFVDDLPKNATGKILKRELRAMELAGKEK
ncbi:MAG: long-chain fatty acid--CoA ligase [Deltaproteobacteria bacterium]|nr:MAG: long-chain fatty acid--CoA ligase [Deltaproteobacteria bacterium]